MRTAIRLLLVLLTMASPAAAFEQPTDDVQRAARDVMNDPEFRHLVRESVEETVPERSELPQWLKDLLESIAKWFVRENSSGGSDGAGLAPIGTLMFYGAIGVAVAVLIFLLVSLLKRFEAPGVKRPFKLVADEDAITPATPPGEYSPSFYEDRAMQFATAGDYRAAIRELVLGGMSWTERAGLIRHRRGLTNRDYVRAVWRDASRREALLLIVESFDLVFFGRRPAEESQYERCLAAFQESFRDRVLEEVGRKPGG